MTQSLSWAGIAALVGGSLFGAGQTPSSVALLMDFDNHPAAASVDEMKKEVAHLLKSTGLIFDWQNHKAGREAIPHAIQFRFKGKCYSDNFQSEISDLAPYGETVALASTPLSRGRVQPFSRIECDQIRKCIGTSAGPGKKQRDVALGRAMGRVVAHELYHILVDTRKHAAHGVAKPVQDASDLVSTGAEFDPAETDKLSSPRRVSGSSAFVPK